MYLYVCRKALRKRRKKRRSLQPFINLLSLYVHRKEEKKKQKKRKWSQQFMALTPLTAVTYVYRKAKTKF